MRQITTKEKVEIMQAFLRGETVLCNWQNKDAKGGPRWYRLDKNKEPKWHWGEAEYKLRDLDYKCVINLSKDGMPSIPYETAQEAEEDAENWPDTFGETVYLVETTKENWLKFNENQN